jgi:hypothetical protein
MHDVYSLLYAAFSIDQPKQGNTAKEFFVFGIDCDPRCRTLEAVRDTSRGREDREGMITPVLKNDLSHETTFML